MSQGSRPRALPASRAAPDRVVSTVPTDGSSARPGVVEVVGVVLVGEEHGVDRTDVLDGDRRPGELARRRSPAEGVPAARRVEGRIGQQAPASDLEQDGRPADVGETHVRTVACCRAQSRTSSAICSQPSCAGSRWA